MPLNKYLNAVLFLLVTTFSGASLATQAMNAEFRTMKECLDGIKASSGQSLEIITDKPTVVSGFLSNKQGFACEQKESGTKGVYYHGWYLVDK